jgi:translation initiation factor eIF-2B subunit beta
VVLYKVLANGGIVGINGSQLISSAAKHHSTPVVVLSELYKLSVEYPFNVEAFHVELSPQSILKFEEGKEGASCFYS